MKVSLVPQKDYKAMKKSVSIEPKKLYDAALDILQPLWSSRTELLTSVSFVYQPKNPVSGEFQVYSEEIDVSETIMVINLAKIKTYRDLIYTIYHEWRHALQLDKIGWDRFYKSSLQTEENYANCKLEKDADSYAFRKESKMKYKNFIINKSAPYSIFIVRKKLNG